MRREDDSSSLLDFGAQKIHHLALQDGIHPGGKFIKKKDGRIDHEDFRDLHAAPETAAQVLHLAVDFRTELKFFDQGTGTARRRRFVESLEARVGEQIIFHRQEQLDRGRLNYRRNPLSDFDGLFHDVVAEDLRGAFGREGERGEHAQQR